MPPSRLAALLALALSLLTLAAYARVGSNDFINYDDGNYVTHNPAVQAGLNGETFRWAWTTLEAGYWHPLTWLSLLLDTSLFGTSAWGYHLTGLLLHTANVVLLFWVLRQMTGAVWRSAVVAALFAVHPLHVESVAWAAERKDVLSTLFGILTLGAYAHYAARPGVGRYGLVLLLFVLGLLAKPMLVTLPCVMLLLDWWPLGRLRLALWLLLEKLPLFAVTAAACGMAFFAQNHSGAVRTLDVLPLPERVANALVGYEAYLASTFWPRGLAIFYPLMSYSLLSWKVIGAALLLGALTALAVWQARQRPYLAVGWFWFVGTLVPVIGLVQVGWQAWADRFSYLPHIGLFIACVWGAADLAARWRLSPVVQATATAVLVLALAACTWVQLGYWRDSETVWSRALDVTAENYFAHDQMGVVLFHKGDWYGAKHHFATSLHQRDWNPAAHYHVGVLLLLERQPKEAEAHLQKAREQAPGDSEIAHHLGQALGLQGRFAEAEQHLRAALQALEAQPESPNQRQAEAQTLDSLGQAVLAQGRRAEAIDCFRRALDLAPDSAEASSHLTAAGSSLP